MATDSNSQQGFRVWVRGHLGRVVAHAESADPDVGITAVALIVDRVEFDDGFPTLYPPGGDEPTLTRGEHRGIEAAFWAHEEPDARLVCWAYDIGHI